MFVIDINIAVILAIIYIVVKLLDKLFDKKNENYGNGEPTGEYEEIRPPKEAKLRRVKIKRRR